MTMLEPITQNMERSENSSEKEKEKDKKKDTNEPSDNCMCWFFCDLQFCCNEC